jgi:uncharacterized membrane protein HdeD (DUF308 family)
MYNGSFFLFFKRLIFTLPDTTLKERMEMKKGKGRSFLVLVGLCIITLGIYILYWLYVNLHELREAFSFHPGETAVDAAQKWFAVYVTTTLVVIIATFSFAFSNPEELHPIVLFFSIIGGIVGGIFFYHYTAAVALAQSKAQLSAFEISKVYQYYLIGLVVMFVGNFIPVLSFIGAILMFVYFYLIQKNLNRIWSDGKFDEE